MPRIEMDYHLAHAAAMDEGCASMRAGGREAWNLDDLQVCVDTFNRLWPVEQDIIEARKRYEQAMREN